VELIQPRTTDRIVAAPAMGEALMVVGSLQIRRQILEIGLYVFICGP